MNELQIRISADTKQLKQAMSRTEQLLKNADNVLKQSSRSAFHLENSLAKLSKQFKAGAISEAEFNKQATILSKELDRQRSNVRAAEQEISRLNKSLGGLKTQPASTGAKQLGGNMSRLTGQIRGTNGVAIEFSRIIQDAPFGLIGIGNNIQQLTQNFSNLQRQTGSTAKAIKISLGAMISPMNLLVLGISAVTAGFTAYQMGAFDFLKSNKDASKELDKFNEELDKFRKNLDSVASARMKGSADASKEIAELNALQNQAKNVNAEMNVRLSAVNQLQKKYPSYFGNLSREAILTGDVGDANENLTKQLLGRAKAQAALNEIGERSLDILTIEERVQQRILDILNLQNKAESLRIKLSQQRAAGAAGPGAAAGQGIVRSIANIEDEITELGKEQIKDVEFLNKLKEKTAKQEEFINGLLGDGVKLSEDQAKAVEKTAESFNKLDHEIENIRAQNELAAEATSKLVDLYKELNDEIRKSDGIIDFKPVSFKVDYDPSQFDKLSEDQKKFYDDLSRSREQLEEFQKDMRRVGVQLSNVFAESFERGIFEGENFFDSIAQGFKRLLAQLASQLAAAAFLKILATIVGGPVGTAFSAGVAANPFGSLFGGARASGGPVSSNKAYLVGEKGPEIFQPSTSGRIIPNLPTSPMVSASGASAGVMQTIDVNVYGQIMNDKIVLSNARGKRENGRFYGING